MAGNDTSHSFGRYLRAVRLERGLSLEHVARETRIGIDILQQIENEDIAGLPAEVYVKGFIRSFAKIIGADGDKAVAAYTRNMGVYRQSARSEADLTRYSSRFWRRLLLSMGLLAVVMAVSIYLLQPAARPPEAPRAAADPQPETVRESRAGTEAAGAPAPAPVSTPAPEPSPQPAASEPPAPAQAAPAPEAMAEPGSPSMLQPYRLNVRATEETWLEIVVDGMSPTEYILKPGDRLALTATEGYRLLIGNAGGIELDLNGSAVPIRGKSGQVRTLELP